MFNLDLKKAVSDGQLLGPHSLGFNVNEWRHAMQFYRIYRVRNEPLPLAWTRDTFLIPGAQGHEMDPTADICDVPQPWASAAPIYAGYVGAWRWRATSVLVSSAPVL